MKRHAQEIFKQSNNRSKYDQEKRLKNTQDFWKKYSTPLVRALNISNKSKDQYSSTDKLIILESDQNENFRKYREKVQ